MSLPVSGHATSWTRRGLVEGVMVGRGQRRAAYLPLVCVVPVPILAGLETLNDRMPGTGRVVACVL